MINYALFIILGLLPSLIWLVFYLIQDKNPEPRGMIIKIFIYGMAITIPAALAQWGFLEFLKNFNLSSLWLMIIYFLCGVAVTEEIFRYLVVRFSVLRSHHFDEPVDAMIYMIIVGLGFAAIENILVLFSLNAPGLVGQTALTFFGRFFGATLLHALCSANIGFFLALSLAKIHGNKLLLFFGISFSIFLHGLYNIAIAKGGLIGITILLFLLCGLFLVVLAEFKKITQLKSTSSPKQIFPWFRS